MELWELGLTDDAIGERMGISAGAAARRRFRMGLAINPEAGAASDSRAVNAQPWMPPAGMVKLRCGMCMYYFSSKDEQARFCPECRVIVSRSSG